MLGRISQSEALRGHVLAAVDGHIARFGGLPRVLVATGDDTLRASLDHRLRVRGCDATHVVDAYGFHAALWEYARGLDVPPDFLIVDGMLPGCSPFHGLGFARTHGLTMPAIALVRFEDDPARTEARRLAAMLCLRSVVQGSLDRLLLGALRRCATRRRSWAA